MKGGVLGLIILLLIGGLTWGNYRMTREMEDISQSLQQMKVPPSAVALPIKHKQPSPSSESKKRAIPG